MRKEREQTTSGAVVFAHTPRVEGATTTRTADAFAHVPAFDDYPYLVTLVLHGLYRVTVLPADMPLDEMREITRRQVEANRLQSCLVVHAATAIYVHLDGTEHCSSQLPRGGLAMTGRLRLCREFPETRELGARQTRLKQFGQRYEPKAGDMLGDPNKGGEPATPDEMIELEGCQPNGVPRGLVRCGTCSRWRGRCLDPDPLWQGLVMTILCLCENDTRCARCGAPLAEERLNSNLYDESDGRIWHVPTFCALSHVCLDPPGRPTLSVSVCPVIRELRPQGRGMNQVEEPDYNDKPTAAPADGGRATGQGAESLCERIMSVLRRLTEDGGSSNFIILSAGENHYVQFRSSCGSAVIYCEAVSNRYLEAPFKLSARQQAQLVRLGWRTPTRRKYPNFYRYWPVVNERDRQAIAEIALATLKIHGWPGDQPLAVKGHLDGMDDDVFAGETAEVLGFKQKKPAPVTPHPDDG